jgi:hypothetical protein
MAALCEITLSNGDIFKIFYDTDPQSPRDWDNLGTIVAWHRRYKLGDEQPKEDPKEYRSKLPKDVILLPVYLYDHSGITINTTGFSCPWDSGQVGFIYVTRERIRQEYSCKRISKKRLESVKRHLDAEIETYDTYLRGEVYGYVREGKDYSEVDSCWGFFGEHKDSGILDELSEEDRKKVLDAL